MNDQSTLLDTPATVTARGRIAVIADVHGESALLKAAIDAIADKASTKLVLLGDLIDRGARLGEHRGEVVPDMEHLGPWIEHDVHARVARTCCEPRRIVDQHLCSSGVEQHGRETGEIREER